MGNRTSINNNLSRMEMKMKMKIETQSHKIHIISFVNLSQLIRLSPLRRDYVMEDFLFDIYTHYMIYSYRLPNHKFRPQ